VTARRSDSTLTLTVWDDGAGLEGKSPPENTGLGYTRERLRHAFGDDHEMTSSPAAGGVEVSIRVPCD
jgi:signal transduction histidine kinase